MKYVLIAAVIFSALCYSACRTSKGRVSSAAYGRYISGFTSGKVDLDEEIKIELSQEVLDSFKGDKKDSAFLEKNMRIYPKVKGNFYWKNDKTIGFKPADRFEEGEEYHVAFKLNKFIHTPSAFKTFDFYFETDHQKFEVTNGQLLSNEGYELEWMRYELTVSTNVAIDKEKIAASFEAYTGKKNLPVQCVEDGNKRYKIVVDSIERKERAGELLLKWNARPAGSRQSGEQVIKIPSLGSYTVLKMEVKDNGDQQVDITFSDPILPNQNFDGLIEIATANKLKFNTTGNVVSVFLAERITGNKLVKVNKGLLNFRNYKMDSTVTGMVEFQGARPALRMQGKGCILPNSQGLLFPFESIGIHSVDVRIIKIKEQNIHQFLQVNELDGYDELTRVGKIVIEKTINIIADTVTPQNQWTTHILDLGKLVQPEPGSLYRVCIRYKKSYTYLPCRNEDKDSENSREYLYETASGQDSTWNEFGWHGEGFDGYNTWKYEDEDPCSKYYYRGGAICRNILASDIGVMYQEEKNKTARIVTTNLLNAAALANTEVTLYAYTQEKIASGITDENGFLQVSLSQKPFLLVARKDKQRAYLKLTNANCLSTSKFEVEGVDQQSGVKGFLYAERGVWRPGDSVFLNFVLNDQSNPLPQNHPIQFEFSDPDGKQIFKKTITENQGHIYPLYFNTSSHNRTGSYTATVTVGNASFSKSILLEYIVPNRMKIRSNVEDKLLAAKDSIIKVKVEWLNGAVGKGLKTQTMVSLKADYNYFKKYEDYVFVAPYNQNFTGKFELEETQTDDSGTALFVHPTLNINNAPGILNVAYTFKAFEQGGGFSIDKATATLSVFDSYVGLKPPSGSNYYGSLDYSKSYPFAYVIVNSDQQKTAGHHLQLKIYEMQNVNWYEADQQDISTFKTHKAKICIRDTQWVAKTGEGTFNFGNIGKKYGKYMMILKDLASGHETGQIVVFDDPYWDRQSSEDADYESIIQLSSSKKKYNVGEPVQLNIPAPESASILINVESDTRIIKQFWVKVTQPNQAITFTTTPEMAPGIYVHATVLQPHHYTKNGAPIRQYGIIPVKIEDPESKLLPVVGIKEEIRPETPSTLQVSEQSGKEMNYSIVLVDEGLLDLTHYRKPDIWQYMNTQPSLKIKTWDMFNQVIGAYSGKIQNVFTIGGDGSYDETEDTKANRFKPAIVNLGNFHLNAGQKQTHKFTLPNYSGRMRAIVVAYCNGKSGSAEQSFFVKKPLMLLTGAPRMMSAKEQYQIPVTVFNMEKKVRKVSVSLKATGLSNMNFAGTQTIQFKGQGDEVVNFSLQVPEETGILRLTIAANDGHENSKEEIEIDVKPTQPVINHQHTMVVAPGATAYLDLSAKGVKGTYAGNIEISDRMSFDFGNRLNYLIQYPHGCVEQTTSSAFAQLFLNDVQDISDSDAGKIKEHIEMVIKKLGQFQTYSGGFAYWPYQYEVNDFASIYVLHFLTEAQRKGFEVPEYMLKNATRYHEEQARQYENNYTATSYQYADKELTQAYRLYLLARMSKADITAMNKLKETTPKNELSKALLAGAYSAIAKEDMARQLITGIRLNPSKEEDYGSTFGSELRDKSMLLLALQRLDKTAGDKLAADIAAQLSGGSWNSTFATALALVSLSEYYSLDAGTIKKYALNDKAATFVKHITKIKLVPQTNAKVPFRNLSGQNLYLVVNEYYADTKTNIPLVNNGIQLKVTYLDMNNKPVQEASLKHGMNFMAKIQVTNNTKASLQDVAVEYALANGWQIISNRYIDDETINKNSSFDYKDEKDDRLYYYCSLLPKETKVFYVLLNASYKGQFYLPLAQCYPMYNEKYKAQQAGKWVSVQ